MDNQDAQDWELEYRSALVETDSTILRGKIAKAQQSITSRRAGLHPSTDRDEIMALDDALHMLQVLKRTASVVNNNPQQTTGKLI
jgi:hypothetical protein